MPACAAADLGRLLLRLLDAVLAEQVEPRLDRRADPRPAARSWTRRRASRRPDPARRARGRRRSARARLARAPRTTRRSRRRVGHRHRARPGRPRRARRRLSAAEEARDLEVVGVVRRRPSSGRLADRPLDADAATASSRRPASSGRRSLDLGCAGARAPRGSRARVARVRPAATAAAGTASTVALAGRRRPGPVGGGRRSRSR